MPTIILSVFISSIGVGSDPFLKQGTISLVSCGISIIITILTSIKLYMKITENSANESELAVQFKTLAIEIFKTLSLPEELRERVGIDYLNKVYTRYTNLVENSEVLNPMNKKDQLLNIDPKLFCDNSSWSSLSSNESPNPLSH
jgi:hypothetical protein